MSGRNRASAAYWLIGLVLVTTQAAVLHYFGQPFFAASGHIWLWANDPFSPDMSQQLTDWYSFSHLIHGFIFFGALRLVAPRVPLGVRLLIAMGIEIAWEITENSPAVIRHYREQALAAGYVGDSIVNSLSDTLMMSLGFFFASRVRARYVGGAGPRVRTLHRHHDSRQPDTQRDQPDRAQPMGAD